MEKLSLDRSPARLAVVPYVVAVTTEGESESGLAVVRPPAGSCGSIECRPGGTGERRTITAARRTGSIYAAETERRERVIM